MAECYISGRKEWHPSDFASPRVFLVGKFANLSFDWRDNERSVDLSVSKAVLQHAANADLQQQHTDHGETNPIGVWDGPKKKLWRAIRNNGTVYLHVHVTHEGASADPQQASFHRLQTIHKVHELIKYAPRRNAKNATLLLGEYFPATPDVSVGLEGDDEEDDDEEEYGEDPALTAPVVSYWKPVEFGVFSPPRDCETH